MRARVCLRTCVHMPVCEPSQTTLPLAKTQNYRTDLFWPRPPVIWAISKTLTDRFCTFLEESLPPPDIPKRCIILKLFFLKKGGQSHLDGPFSAFPPQNYLGAHSFRSLRSYLGRKVYVCLPFLHVSAFCLLGLEICATPPLSSACPSQRVQCKGSAVSAHAVTCCPGGRAACEPSQAMHSPLLWGTWGPGVSKHRTLGNRTRTRTKKGKHKNFQIE